MTTMKEKVHASAAKVRQRHREDDGPDGVCHLYRDGQEEYTDQMSEQLCKANCDQMNESDQGGNWTYTWNPIA